MTELVRVGISLPDDLLRRFDRRIADHGYTNRSEAIRDMIRERLVTDEWSDDRDEVAGTFTLVYDHHQGELVSRMLSIQHDHEGAVISTLHVHLDHDNCLEVLVLRGPAHRLRALTDELRALRGVKHTTLAMTSTGKNLL
ncbi:nickel-responsive transcriptional regulator NikR [Candidatus Sumerlaeota bacterium]|nr:nickel-responsive transcriptional regulator NikR [Candidatus Sumerlaeota bacterium]